MAKLEEIVDLRPHISPFRGPLIGLLNPKPYKPYTLNPKECSAHEASGSRGLVAKSWLQSVLLGGSFVDVAEAMQKEVGQLKLRRIMTEPRPPITVLIPSHDPATVLSSTFVEEGGT